MQLAGFGVTTIPKKKHDFRSLECLPILKKFGAFANSEKGNVLAKEVHPPKTFFVLLTDPEMEDAQKDFFIE